MTMPLMRPKRKNPVLRTRQMNVPPAKSMDLIAFYRERAALT